MPDVFDKLVPDSPPQGGDVFDKLSAAPAAPIAAPIAAPRSTGDVFDRISEPKINVPSTNKDQSFLGKAWDWVNAPLVDRQSIEKWGVYKPANAARSLFGMRSLEEEEQEIAREHPELYKAVKGIQAGVGNIESGMTSPLSIGLTLGTFAGGALESIGVNTLKALGLPALAEYAPNVVKTVKSAVDAGFTIQQAVGFLQTAPRALDAAKEGDTEKALELFTEGTAQGVFAGLGAHQTIRDAGGLLNEIKYKAGIKVKPSEENLMIQRAFEPHSEALKVAFEDNKQWESATRDKYEKIFKDSGLKLDEENLMRSRMYREAGDKQTMAKWYNAVAEAAGRPDKVTLSTNQPYSLPSDYQLKTDATGFLNIDNPSGLSINHTLEMEKSKKPVGFVLLQGRPEVLKNSVEVSSSQIYDPFRGQGYGPALYKEAAQHASEQGADYLISDVNRTPEAEHRWQQIQQQNTGRVELVDFAQKNPNFAQFAGKRYVWNIKDLKMDRELSWLVDENKLKDSYSDKEIDGLLKVLDPRNVKDEHIQLANEVGERFDKNGQMAQQAGILEKLFKNYVTRIWENPDNEGVRRFNTAVDSHGFKDNTSMARRRVFDHTIEGMLLGNKLAPHDFISLAAFNGNEFANVIAANRVLNDIMDKHFMASDGRPAIAPSGDVKVVTNEKGDAALLVNPNSMRDIRISDKVIEGYRKSGLLDKFLADGTIVKAGQKYKFPTTGISMKPEQGNFQPTVGEFGIGRSAPENVTSQGTEQYLQDAYAFDPHDYRSMEHPAFRDWKYTGPDNDGNPVMLKTDLKVHPEFYEYLKRRIGEVSPVRAIGPLKLAFALGREAKGSLLGLSPFHLLQEGLRAIMTGINPLGVEKFNPLDPMHRLAAAKGVFEDQEYKGIEAFEDSRMESHSKIIQNIPGLGKLQNWLQDFLFNRYIPGLKLRAFKSLYEEYANAYKEWSPDKVADVAAMDTVERFGGIPYKRLGRSIATQDLFRLAALAPDWLESEMRFMARTFGEEGKIARMHVARMAIGMWATSRIVNYLISQNFHNEAPFGLVFKDKEGKEKVYSVRTLPTDMLHAVSDPTGFLKGRQAPLLRATWETITGRDELGRKIPTHNIALNILRQAAPIPIQSAVKQITGEQPDLTTPDQIVKAVGGTVLPYRTEAQKMAAQFASEKSESGPVDESQLRRHQAIIQFEDKLRGREIDTGDVHKMVEQGALSVKEGKQIIKNYEETNKMNGDIASLYVRASRLPMTDFLSVWDAMDNTEKAALSRLMIKKRNNYYKKAMTDFTPQQRASDPTYRRLRQMFPSVAPF